MTARGSLGERARRLGVALLWIVLYGAVCVALAWLLLKLNPVSRASPWFTPLGAVALALASGGATWLVGVRLARRGWGHWGWQVPHGALRTFAAGAGLGLLMAALAVGLAFVTSRATVRLTGDWVRYVDVAGPLALLLLAAALFEEFTFRGFPLRRLADAIGPGAAVGVAAVGFAAAHAVNPNAGPLGLANVALAAVWLSFAFFSSGGMVYAWALHFGWNAGLALLFDAPVSGQRLSVPAVEYAAGRHAWVDGGAFGPEGGIVASVMLVAGTLAVLGRRIAQPRQWLR